MSEEVILENGYKRKNGKPVCDKPLLSVNNVSFSYEGGPLILSGVDFHILDNKEHGQVCSILGPSGCGKSTLMNIITGTISEGYSGSVEIYDDKKCQVIPVHAGLVGKVTQNYFFSPFYTVRQNLELAAAKKNHYTKEEQKRRIDEMLADFEMTEFQDCYAKQLSGGQRQRIAIIIQLLCSEHFLVLDEPFTSLDPIKKNDLVRLINKVSESDEHNTIIVVTHDIRQAIACSDTLLLIGRDSDENGKKIPGAYVKERFNLLDMGLAYRPDIIQLPEYIQLLRDLDALFPSL